MSGRRLLVGKRGFVAALMIKFDANIPENCLK